MGETVSSDTGREAGESARLAWIDRSPLTLCLGSLAIAVVAGLVQVSFGSYSVSVAEAWRAVVDTTVLLDPRWLLNFLLGEQLMRSVLGFQGDLPDLPTMTLIVWNVRLPRVFVVMIVGMNLAVSGAIFQAVTRNELASPFILGVSSGAGLLVLLTLVVFPMLASALPVIAAAGIVGFVGLIVPHVVRNVVGSGYKRLVVGCLFAGPALLVAADVGARLATPVLVGGSGQLPVGIVTGLVGGPYFLYLMRKQDQLGEI